MAALFSKPKKPDMTAQLAAQRRQEDKIREQELDENIEKGSRSRVLNARLQSRGVPQLVNQGAGGSGTLGG